MEGRGIGMWPLLALLYLLMAWPTKASGAQVPDLRFVEYLDTDRSVLLKWGFDDVQGNITFRITVQTTGWVGFGLSPNGDMIGADMVIGGVGAEGIYFTAKPIKLIYAYGDTDEIEYHSTRRGTKEVNLLNYMPRVTPQHRDYIDVTMDNFIIPAVKTHYQCRVRKMPRLNVTHHIEPVIDNVDFIYHIVLYACPAFVKDEHEGECYTENVVDECYTMMAAWAPGAGAFELPEDVGIPIGGNNNDTLYRLEIHYNNPTSKEGRRDSSGLRLYYTSELRRHSAGTLTTGVVLTNDYKIPPGATQFHTYGTGGKQVDFLAVNEHYNLEFEETHKLGNIKTIKAVRI
ncbi:hypothetical protein CRUP_027124 [Coryphaenoides rupestris]|nr:hypothetical protein CRUP_027124 [Coryphaenoides rupestris]